MGDRIDRLKRLLGRLRGRGPSTSSVVSAARRGSDTTRSGLDGLVGRLLGGLARLLGASGGNPLRPLAVLLVLLAVGMSVALAAYVGSALPSTEASSGPFLRTVLSIATNWFLWAGLTVLVVIVVFTLFWRLAAHTTAKHTSYSATTVRRLRAEVQSTDGSTRLIGTEGHSFDQLRAKLLRAFAGQAGDEHPARTDANDDSAVDVRSPEERALEGGVEGRLTAAETDTDTDGDTESDATVSPETQALIDLLADTPDTDGRDTAEADLETLLDEPSATDDAADSEPDAALSELFADAAERNPDQPLPVRPAGADSTSDADAEDEPDRDGDDRRESDESRTKAALGDIRTAIQTARMDLATSFSFSEFGWRFVIPALTTAAAAFVALQSFWLHPAVYALIFLASSVVGSVVYLSTKVWRRRTLNSLRDSGTTEAWRRCAVLAKRVETDGPTLFVAWMAGHVYADYDKARLANTVADRWHQRINDESVAPAVQEKFARNLRQCIPTLETFWKNDDSEGLVGIRRDMIEVVAEAEDPAGMVPKKHLAQRVVDRGDGVGHDPDLVARAYEELVPAALAETTVELEDPDLNTHEVTIVTLRDKPIPDDLAQIQSSLSSQIKPGDDGAYRLPTVDVPAFDDSTRSTREVTV